MTTDEGIVTADCQFCGAHYEFDPRTLGFEAEEAPGERRLTASSRSRWPWRARRARRPTST